MKPHGDNKLHGEFECAQATAEDFSSILFLLTDYGLPIERITISSLKNFLVVRQDGRAIGCCALEPHGTDGVIRSMSVDEPYRGKGAGSSLLAACERRAVEKEIGRVYALTAKKGSFFECHGYPSLDSQSLPPVLRDHPYVANLLAGKAKCYFKNLK